MNFRQLGRSGLQVSEIGLGTNMYGGKIKDAREVRAILRQALDLGVNFIDTANIYGEGESERLIGEALQGDRHRFILATKVAGPMGDGPNLGKASRAHIYHEVDISLGRLQTDYVDLYQVHFPDPITPIEETLRALDDLVRQGKVRYIGCSHYSAWQICEAIWTSRALNLNSYVSVQPEYNLLDRKIEADLGTFCRSYGIGIIPYHPLASGFLTGKYRPNEPIPPEYRGHHDPNFRWLTQRNWRILSRLEAFCGERGIPMGQIALAWLLANPVVSTVIAGASRPEQVMENAKASGYKLTQEDLSELNNIVLDDAV